MWQRTKHTSKSGFDKLWGWADKLGTPVNKLSNKLGSEAFWPMALDKECDKAARILRSFCKDGFYEEEILTTLEGPRQKQKVLKKIPAEVIQNAKGLAIFTTMRTGLWVSGAGGSGVLVGRTEDGTWSPPSGILLHTGGLGFLVGVDIYDCVVIINTQTALDAFSKFRCTVGGEISAVAGPVGVGGVIETEVHKRQAPVFTYLKSRGFYAGVQVDGTVIIERTDENERFYGEKLAGSDILAGKVLHPPYEIRTLMETIKAAEGDNNVDLSLVPSEPPPGDYEIGEESAESEEHVFGVPDKEDPDPFGVLALEKEGLHIVEAGTKMRPESTQFEFHPSPQSPIFSTFSRRSVDSKSIRDSRSVSRRSSWRTSGLSTMAPSIQTVDMCTQTDFDSPAVSISSPRISESNSRVTMAEIPEDEETLDPAPVNVVVKELTKEPEEEPKDQSEGKVKEEPEEEAKEKSLEESTEELTKEPEEAPKNELKVDPEEGASEQKTGFITPYAEDDVVVEEPVVHQVHQAIAPQTIRARLVTVTKPTPPRLPARNPGRSRRGPLVINADPLNPAYATKDQSIGTSPQTPPSSSERPSVRSDSASSVSSRDSVSSTEAMEAMNKRVSGMSMASGETSVKKEEENESPEEDDHLQARRDSDEFHSIPPTPERDTESPLKKTPSEEDFS